jgi:hypothetical protein
MAKRKKAAKTAKIRKCFCMKAPDGKYYCFRQVQGRWEECDGPFDTKAECEAEGTCA